MAKPSDGNHSAMGRVSSDLDEELNARDTVASLSGAADAEIPGAAASERRERRSTFKAFKPTLLHGTRPMTLSVPSAPAAPSVPAVSALRVRVVGPPTQPPPRRPRRIALQPSLESVPADDAFAADAEEPSWLDRIQPLASDADAFNLSVAARPGWPSTQRLSILPPAPVSLPPPVALASATPSYPALERKAVTDKVAVTDEVAVIDKVAVTDEVTPAVRSSSRASSFVQDWMIMLLLVLGMLALLGLCLLLAAIFGVIHPVAR